MAEAAAAAQPEQEEIGTWDSPDGQATLKSDPKPVNKAGVGATSSNSSESDEELSRKPTLIRQVKSRSRWGLRKQEGNDDKLYVRGSLNCSLLNKSIESKTEEEFAEEGIYQGLVMTNKEKEELGILPEAIYMTTKLMQKKDLIESMLLSTAVEPADQIQAVVPANKTSSSKANKERHQSASKKSRTPPDIFKKSSTSSSTGSGTRSKICYCNGSLNAFLLGELDLTD